LWGSENLLLDFLDLRVRKLKSYPMPWPKPKPTPTPQPIPRPKTRRRWLNGDQPSNPNPPTKPKPIPAPHPMPAPKPGPNTDVRALGGLLLFPRNFVTENCFWSAFLSAFQVQKDSALALVSISLISFGVPLQRLRLDRIF